MRNNINNLDQYAIQRRVDVLRGMSLKLGPALKIYAHIQFLQGYKSIDD